MEGAVHLKFQISVYAIGRTFNVSENLSTFSKMHKMAQVPIHFKFTFADLSVETIIAL